MQSSPAPKKRDPQFVRNSSSLRSSSLDKLGLSYGVEIQYKVRNWAGEGKGHRIVISIFKKNSTLITLKGQDDHRLNYRSASISYRLCRLCAILCKPYSEMPPRTTSSRIFFASGE